MATPEATARAAEAWDGSVTGAGALRAALATRVVVRDDYPRPLRHVAGFAVRGIDGGAGVRAAVVLLDADTLAVIDRQRVSLATTADPGAPLSFRAMPALLEVLSRLSAPPDLALVGGHGVAHPQGFGIAAHLGVVADLPCIGVSRQRLVGTAPDPHPMRGAYTALRTRGQRQIGWLLRSHAACAPLVVSPGHRVAPASTADLVMRFVTDARLPEPLRLAALLVATRAAD